MVLPLASSTTPPRRAPQREEQARRVAAQHIVRDNVAKLPSYILDALEHRVALLPLVHDDHVGGQLVRGRRLRARHRRRARLGVLVVVSLKIKRQQAVKRSLQGE